MRLIFIIPCYNEEETIGGLIAEVKGAYPDADVLVINDGSRDATGSVARRAGANVADLPYNMGIGAATQLGYKFAHAGKYNAACQLDGDGQHDPAEIVKILAPILDGEADIVVGSRFITNEGFRSTAIRRVGIKLFSNILSFLTRERMTDPTSGFRAFNARAICLLAREYPEDYPGVESLFLSHLAGLRIKEVPVVMRPRESGRSSITVVRSFYYVVKVMMVLLIWLLRKRPVSEETDA